MHVGGIGATFHEGFLLEQNIHDKVLELDFEEATPEVWAVESQYSSNDGVIVQVVGSLQIKVSV